MGKTRPTTVKLSKSGFFRCSQLRRATLLVGLVFLTTVTSAWSQDGYAEYNQLKQPTASGESFFERPLETLDPVESQAGQIEIAPSGETSYQDLIDPMPEIDLVPQADGVDLLHEFWGYRYSTSSMDWIFGGANQFGSFSLINNHYQKAGVQSGFGVDLDFYFLNGPRQTDMPPRVYDFGIGYQCRKQLGIFAYDVAGSVVAASDFEGSSRKGIRYPSHAVGYLQMNPWTQLVFGVDYLDRADIKILPVGGLIWFPNEDMRFELVFPRPRLVFRLPSFSPTVISDSMTGEDTKQKEHWLYLSGELGGGTWAIERAAIYDDLATYRDLRFSIGIETIDGDASRSAIEISYLFDRSLKYTSGNGNQDLVDTAMIRWITWH